MVIAPYDLKFEQLPVAPVIIDYNQTYNHNYVHNSKLKTVKFFHHTHQPITLLPLYRSIRVVSSHKKMGAYFSSDDWKGYEHQLLSDTKRQTVTTSAEEKGASAIMRHPTAKDGFKMYLKDDDQKDLDSGWKVANYAFKKYADSPLFGYRPFLNPEEDVSARGTYAFDSYKVVQQQVYALANGLRSLNLPGKSNIGIYASNRAEWMITNFANWNLSYRTVALYDTLGASAVQYIVYHAECEVIFVQKNKLKHLFEAVRSGTNDMKLLKYIVQYDCQAKYNNKHEALSDEDKQTAEQLGLQLMGFTQLLDKGDDESTDLVPNADDLAYIMYTSGTTGNPKGVMISHKMFSTALASASRALSPWNIDPNTSDRHVSFLPLAHILESEAQLLCVYGGARIAFFNGSIKKLADDWKEIEPTIMFGVPRIFSKTYDKIKLKVEAAGGVKKWLFDRALLVSSTLIRSNQRHSLYDTIMWNKVAQQIGFGKVKFLISGGAPMPPHVAEFLRIILKDALVVQGYGLTESTGCALFTEGDDFNLGHVGVTHDNVECRLIDAPECEYYVSDKPYPRGEVQLRGPIITTGYFKNEEGTNKVISQETKWFSTGDIGRINPNGTVSIIDRRKNMFKTSSGEYIASEKCEDVYGKAAAVGQIWIYGNSFKSFVVAVIVPDAMWLVNQLREKGVWKDEQLTPATDAYCNKFEEIVSGNYDLVKGIMSQNINKTETESDLKRFERIKDFQIEFEIDELLQGFNVDNGTLTPTFKKKRPQLLKRYKEQIKELYAKNGEPANENEHW
eukprot:191833_1